MISTVSIPATQGPSADHVPELRAGDRLTRAEFERRYAAMPHVKKAELIEGVVYMPSSVTQEFVLGRRPVTGGAMAELDNLLDRSHLMLKPPAAEQDAAQTLDKVQDTIRGESEH